MTTIHQTARPATSSTARRRVRAVAVGGAVLTTSLLWFVAHALGINLRVDQHNGSGSQVINLPLVIGFTLVVSLLGWGVLAVLEHYTRLARTIWSVLAVAVLLLSFVPIVAVSATSGTKTMLSLIHIAVAAVLIPLLRRGTPKVQSVSLTS